jgi:hypothetical protein
MNSTLYVHILFLSVYQTMVCRSMKSIYIRDMDRISFKRFVVNNHDSSFRVTSTRDSFAIGSERCHDIKMSWGTSQRRQTSGLYSHAFLQMETGGQNSDAYRRLTKGKNTNTKDNNPSSSCLSNILISSQRSSHIDTISGNDERYDTIHWKDPSSSSLTKDMIMFLPTIQYVFTQYQLLLYYQALQECIKEIPITDISLIYNHIQVSSVLPLSEILRHNMTPEPCSSVIVPHLRHLANLSPIQPINLFAGGLLTQEPWTWTDVPIPPPTHT